MQRGLGHAPRLRVQSARIQVVITQEQSCSPDSRFRRKLSETTGRGLLGTQRPQMLWLTAWGWSSLYTECVEVLPRVHPVKVNRTSHIDR